VSGLQRLPFAELERAIEAISGVAPTTAEYHRLSTLVADHPAVAAMNRLDPFSAEYRERAMELYLELRGRAGAYEPVRDEASVPAPQADLWTGLPPWSFRDAGFLAEFLYCWGHMIKLLALPAGGSARVLEYGPGSGQLLLMLARVGAQSFGVDIDPQAVANLERQAAAMGLDVRAEQAAFGEGFAGETFDRIVFFEAFHHAFDFDALLVRLRERLRPGGRLVLCGEPVVTDAGDGVPYAWGPRLDGLSLFCIRRYGWMELGFTHGFLMEAFARNGWSASFHPFDGCGRANAYVAVLEGEAVPVVTVRPGVLRTIARQLPAPARRVIRKMMRLVR
jgi:SAM-dependent methyltransferase